MPFWESRASPRFLKEDNIFQLCCAASLSVENLKICSAGVGIGMEMISFIISNKFSGHSPEFRYRF